MLVEGESAHLITDQSHSYVGAADVWTQFTMAVLERGGQRLAVASSDVPATLERAELADQ